MGNETLKIGTTTFYASDVKHYQPLSDGYKTKFHVTLKDGTSLFLDDNAGGQIVFGRNTENGHGAVRMEGVNGMHIFQQGANFDLSACNNYTLELEDGKAANVNIHNQIGSQKTGKILSKDSNDTIKRDNDVYTIWEHNPKIGKVQSFDNNNNSKDIGLESLYISEDKFEKMLKEGKIDPNNFVTN